jgi:hypothetical protein
VILRVNSLNVTDASVPLSFGVDQDSKLRVDRQNAPRITTRFLSNEFICFKCGACGPQHVKAEASDGGAFPIHTASPPKLRIDRGHTISHERICAPRRGHSVPLFRLRRRYAVAPAGALLTGLVAALGPGSRRHVPRQRPLR